MPAPIIAQSIVRLGLGELGVFSESILVGYVMLRFLIHKINNNISYDLMQMAILVQISINVCRYGNF